MLICYYLLSLYCTPIHTQWRLPRCMLIPFLPVTIFLNIVQCHSQCPWYKRTRAVGPNTLPSLHINLMCNKKMPVTTTPSSLNLLFCSPWVEFVYTFRRWDCIKISNQYGLGTGCACINSSHFFMNFFYCFSNFSFSVLSIAAGQNCAISVLRECLPLCHEVCINN